MAPPKTPRLGPQKSVYVPHFLGKDAKKRDPHKLFRGDVWIEKGVPNGPLWATKSLVHCFSPALTCVRTKRHAFVESAFLAGCRGFFSPGFHAHSCSSFGKPTVCISLLQILDLYFKTLVELLHLPPPPLESPCVLGQDVQETHAETPVWHMGSHFTLLSIPPNLGAKIHPPNLGRRRTNVQQLTCNIDLSKSFYYLFFSFVLLELKPLCFEGESPGGKILKKCEKVLKSVTNYETILPFSCCPLVFL